MDDDGPPRTSAEQLPERWQECVEQLHRLAEDLAALVSDNRHVAYRERLVESCRPWLSDTVELLECSLHRLER